MVKLVRTSERGATIFVVVLVLTMLTGIGVFAVRAASMANLAAGSTRGETQNHYVSEYALHGAINELGSPRMDEYVRRLNPSKMDTMDTCLALKGTSSGDAGAVPCLKLYMTDMQLNTGGRTFFQAASSTGDGGSTVVPGSLGPTANEGDFVVEVTEPVATGPVAGASLSGGAPNKYLQVVLTSSGAVRPTGACDDKTATMSGSESSRAFVVIGPTQ